MPVPPVLVTAEDVTAGKPDPACYRRAAAVLGVAIAGCLVFEDAPAGIAAARAAGAACVVINAVDDGAADPRLADYTGLSVTRDDRGALRVGAARGGSAEMKVGAAATPAGPGARRATSG